MHEEHVATLAVLFFSYIVRGITGFGSGLISVPLLAHWLPLQFIVPFVLSLDYVAALVSIHAPPETMAECLLPKRA